MRLLTSSPVAATNEEASFVFNGSKLSAFARLQTTDITKPRTNSTEDMLQLVHSVTSVLVTQTSAGQFFNTST